MSERPSKLSRRYGPWAVVTGASDGIGREFVMRLAAAGLDVVVAARRGDVLAALAREVEATHHVRVKVVAVDLATPEGVTTLLAETASLEVGLLVAAAGFGTSGTFAELEVTSELEMIDVNCRAVVALAHEFGRRFARAGRGGIVLMSSLLAFQGVPRATTYAATKAFVQVFAEGLRLELRPHGVDVIASAPGPIRSGFASRAAMRMSFAQTPRAVAAATLSALGRRTTVRPGWLSKLLELSLAILPRWGRVRVMALVMRGMTKTASGRRAAFRHDS